MLLLLWTGRPALLAGGRRGPPAAVQAARLREREGEVEREMERERKRNREKGRKGKNGNRADAGCPVTSAAQPRSPGARLRPPASASGAGRPAACLAAATISPLVGVDTHTEREREGEGEKQ